MAALDVAQGLGRDASLAGNLVQTALIRPQAIHRNIKNISHALNISDISLDVKRQIAFVSWQDFSMTSRQILGTNLTALMNTKWARQKELHSNKKVGSRLQISDSTVGCIRRGENSTGVDMIDKIAGLYCLQPWQLLVPDFDTANPPMLRAMNEHERALYDRLHDALQALENR